MEDTVRVFDPWKGRSYGLGSRFRAGVLILGDAHYDAPEKRAKSLDER